MVAWTNAPRAAALAMVQPDCCGLIPSCPVSTYGVARPCAVSGFAGTMMSQLTLAAAVAAAATDGSLGLAEGLAPAPNAAWLTLVESLSVTAITRPITRAIASGMATVTAIR